MSKTVTQASAPRDGATGGELENQQTITNGAPFTADELAAAMSQSTIKGDWK